MKKYNPKQIESKWQKDWEAKKLYEAMNLGKRNFMLLAEFPYTSGNLHMGHWFTYAIADIYARYLRMNGCNVMYPIGFDAFGLPAENAAIKNNSTPDAWTKQNIRNMAKQLKSIGATFDWSRAIDTSSPDYYKWTQWIFLKLYEKGLAYRGETIVNWCPNDKTVLANEQVVNGCCERCDVPVEQKKMTQWMFKITSFADALVDDLKELDWPEDTKTAQINWIGKSEGAVIKFKVKSFKVRKVNDKQLNKLEELDELLTVSVFTTRPDTLFGATYLVLAPEHEMVKELKNAIQNWPEVEKYIEQTRRKTELQRKEEAGEKTGVELKGIKAINPANNEEIPIWVADYVLGGYGTGAIMAVPAHDQRDFEFAKKFELPIREVIQGGDVSKDAYDGNGKLVNSRKFDGTDSEKAKWEIAKFVGGEKQTQYRLRDWILSRQRYWGAPIPLIFCENCKKSARNDADLTQTNAENAGWIPVPEEDLPVKLPNLDDFLPVEGGKSPLARAEKWVKVKCPKCGSPSERETDTMDTFVDSSWYFIRYTDPKNKKYLADKEKMSQWLPAPLYIGGREHNTMHLLYARFITKALHDIGVVEFSEPFLSRRNHGVIMGPDGKRMSKSRGNVVDPDVEVAKYGADTVRMNFAFLGPFEQDYAWNFNNISGISRFLNRVWNLFEKPTTNNPRLTTKKESINIEIKLNQAIRKIGEDIQNLKFNTGVSELMKLLNVFENEISEGRQLSVVSCKSFLKLLAPFAPHLAEELWTTALKNKNSIHLDQWPEYDEMLLVEETVTIPVQVNGKLRDTIHVKKGLTEEEIKELILNREKIKKYLEGKEVKKFVYIQDKLTNIVV